MRTDRPLNAFERVFGRPGQPAHVFGVLPSAPKPAGRPGVPRINLAPRQYKGHGASIAGRAASQAQNDRSAAIRRGMLGPAATPSAAPVLPPLPLGEGGGQGAAGAGGALDAFDRGTRAAKAQVGAVHRPAAVDAVQGGFTPPDDLQAFVASKSVRDVADALGMSRGTAHNLQRGYWPADARKLLTAWDAYKGRVAPQQTRWVLRRVSSAGNVGYGCRTWSAPALQARTDQTVAVARIDDTRLLVQTIDLPAERFELVALM